jgi:dienelactone hydrolase
VLYLHGARWNLNGSVFRMSRWVDLGFNVLAVDYRGFGKSTELLPSEETAYADARVALDELKRREPDPSRRFIYGHSLGGALAIDLAAGPLKQAQNEVGGIIIESTFTSIPAVVRAMKYGWVPGIELAVTQPFDSATKIGKVETPLLIIHGTSDGIVPHAMADELFAAPGFEAQRMRGQLGGVAGQIDPLRQHRHEVGVATRQVAQDVLRARRVATLLERGVHRSSMARPKPWRPNSLPLYSRYTVPSHSKTCG